METTHYINYFCQKIPIYWLCHIALCNYIIHNSVRTCSFYTQQIDIGKLYGLFLSLHLGQSGMLEAVHSILVVMEKFYPRISFFSFQGDQTVLFFPSQTVYSVFISDAQNVFSSWKTEFLLFFDLGRYTLLWRSPWSSESTFQLICSHEKRKSHTFLQNFWPTKISSDQFIAFFFPLNSFSALSVDPHPTFFPPKVSLCHSAHRNFSMFFYVYFATRKLFFSYVVQIVFWPQTKIPSFILFIFCL